MRVPVGYVLELAFSDGQVRTLDVEPLLCGPAFAPLRADYAAFAEVRLDAEAGTIVWPSGVGLAHETLYQTSKPVRPA